MFFTNDETENEMRCKQMKNTVTSMVDKEIVSYRRLCYIQEIEIEYLYIPLYPVFTSEHPGGMAGRHSYRQVDT